MGRPRSPEINDAICTAVLDLVHGGATLTSISMVNLAQRTGISRNSLYRRWTTKGELYSAVVASMKPSLPGLTGQSARENLVALLHAYFVLAVDGNHLGMGHAIMVEAQNFPDLYEQYLTEIVAPFDHAIKLAIRRGKETGEIRVDIDENFLSEILISIAFTVMTSTTRVGRDLDSPIQRMTDVVFDGVSTK